MLREASTDEASRLLDYQMKIINVINTFLFISIGLSVSFSAFSAPDSCGTPKNSKDVVSCAWASHPAIKRSRTHVEQAEAGIERAGQRINPEIDGQWMLGQSLGDINTSAEASLLFTFEVGGKRSSRMNLANSQKLLSEAEISKTKEIIFTEALKHLYRSRQIKEELGIIDETISTFRQVLDQYRKRPRLSPEQEVSSSVLTLAEADYVIKKSQLNTEWAEAVKVLELATGGHFRSDVYPFSDKRKEWPRVLPMSGRTDLKGAEVQAATAGMDAAQMEYELAKAESYPDLKIGPTIGYDNQGGLTSASVGVSFSFPLQILSLNGGGRAVALKSISAAEVNQAQLGNELGAELETLIKKYNRIIENISLQPTRKLVEKLHKEAEGHFNRGVVSSALLLEAHRQLLDLITNQNQYELEALEALIRITILKGDSLEAIL